MPVIQCRQCHQPYPPTGVPFRCRNCGGTFDFYAPPVFDPEKIEPDLPGIWRYRHAFDLFARAPVVTLGEGNTPLVWEKVNGKEVGLKLESLNPTGSFKDRGSAVLVSQLLGRGVQAAVEDSSGNAGASFAAYAARARMKGRVYVPEAASGPKRMQIEVYGAELVGVPGPRSAAAQAVLQEVEQGGVYASHAYLPFGLAGIATIAYELWHTVGSAPGTVITPVGHGSLLLGIVRGFAALKAGGWIDAPPFYLGVQTQACAPLVAAFQKGLAAMAEVNEGSTVAEGIRVRNPVYAEALLREIPAGMGAFHAVEEETILPAYQDLAKRGFLVEPTSAVVWSAFKQFGGNLPEPVVLVISGSGLKYQPKSKN